MLNSIEKSNFVVVCCVIEKCAGLILPLSKMLQMIQLDIFSTDELIKSIPLALSNDRNNFEGFF